MQLGKKRKSHYLIQLTSNMCRCFESNVLIDLALAYRGEKSE